MEPVIESQYPISFRGEDSKQLGAHLKNRHSVMLIGMKRVGISSFLRFFVYHRDIPKTFIKDKKEHLFIPVDFNDLVEREIGPFWTLTLKRIVDVVGHHDCSAQLKKQVELLFLDSIQSQDLFLTIDSVRKCLALLSKENIVPTIFLLRFDRLKDSVTPAFFDNLQGLKDATHGKLAYVFTSYRSLDKLAHHAFLRSSRVDFSHDMYIRPAALSDMKIIFETFKKNYTLSISADLEQALFGLSNGYVRYLQLALIILNELKDPVENKDALFELLTNDERIYLQSEELWESLTSEEQAVLSKIEKKESVTDEEKRESKYLWDTGFVSEDNTIFSELFSYYLKQKNKQPPAVVKPNEFTKKELLLFKMLQEHLGEICERETIIEVVWREVEELGVSDWAIDRLVARVRQKLKIQNSKFEIQTIKTRGYKLVSL